MTAALRLGDRATGRANNFDVLRFVLASLVILSHSYPLLRGGNETEPLMRWTRGQHTFGELAVEGFFLLSGFLIAQSWERSRGLFDYLRRRVLRIYPGFTVALALTVLVAGPLGAASLEAFRGWFRPQGLAWSVANLVTYDPRAPWMFPSNPIHSLNGSLWSIRYEFLCYLMVAALGLAGILARRGLMLALLAATLAGYAWLLYGGANLDTWKLQKFVGSYNLWLRMLPQFLAGSTFYAFRDRVPCRGDWALASLLGLVAAGWLGGFSILFPVLGGYLLLWLAFTPRIRLHEFAKRGDVSYGMYLYAFPVQQLLVKWLGTGISPLVLFALAFVVTLVLAALSFHLVERPFMAMKGRRTAAPRPVPAVEGVGA